MPSTIDSPWRVHERRPSTSTDERAVRPRRERSLSVVALTATFVCFAGAMWHTLGVGADATASGEVSTALLALLFVAVLLTLLSGSVLYQVCRFGYLDRLPVDDVERFPGTRELETREQAPSVLMLVPSYKEEPVVIRQALLSAMLQDHPNRRIVLLVDDPPEPTDAADRTLLEQARSLARELDGLIDGPRRRTRTLHAEMAEGLSRHEPVERWSNRLATELAQTQEWLGRVIRAERVRSHTDTLFVDRVVRAWADNVRRMREAVATEVSTRDLLSWSNQLRALFDVTISSFERKQWVNLPHEPNKAMNINAYLSLVGRSWRAERSPVGHAVLHPTSNGDAELVVPDADYVVTLDADSILDPHYVLRLVGELELPGNERLAVIQTPYSAVQGAPNTLERVAGATTDLQYVVHQGFTRWDATFWVGANAVLRMSAIRSIASSDFERGWPIERFIQDRTVIEDTESSIDLAALGWRLHNVPERLSWSATPPDFGALVIQRRRWANGGLIIFPKLVRRRRELSRATFLLRSHYLLSPAISNIAVLLLVLCPFAAMFQTWWLPLCAVPYFAIQHRDLRHLGYRRAEIIRIWSLNLLLVPVNLAGVAKSLHQATTGTKTPFARTPKVEDRTAIPRLFIAAPIAFAISAGVSAVVRLRGGVSVSAVFALLTCALLLYAILTFIGPRAAVADLFRRQA